MCGTTLSTALALVSLSAAPARAVTPGTQNGNMIVPDGRTATSLSTSGRTTKITTSTLSGGNAYNSFSTFTEAAGNTVNLVVPGKANDLVNLVRNGAVDIEGVLNSYKNGVLGGNIIFADSYGFVVGKSGVINTGSLSVVTPTGGVMDSLISAGGVVDPVLGAQIVSGNVPVSADGSVSIRGMVNAAHAVLITAHDVEIAGSFQAAAQAASRRALFEAAVNVNGLVEGGQIAVHDGSVQIVATGDVDVSGAVAAGGVSQSGSVSIQAGGDVSLSGSIAAGAVRSGSGGSVQIVSGADMSVAATAAIRADGQGGSGGQMRLYADGDLDVADGATFSALGQGAGAGGKVELSAAQTATIGQIDLQLSATSGVDGSLLIDPYALVIGSQAPQTGSSSDYSLASSIFSHGASITLTADSSITLENGGILDSRDLNGSGQSIGDSGAISLSAPSITIQSGGQILAGAVNGSGVGATSYASGAVTLTATATAASGGVASIAIGDNSGGRATVSGGDLLFQATANLPQTTDHATVQITSADVTASGALTASATASGGQSVELLGAAATADVLASVNVGGSAVVTAQGAASLTANATATTDATGLALMAGQSGPDASAAIATNTSVAQVSVTDQAHLTTLGAGSKIELASTNTVSSTATADGSGSTATTAAGSVAVNVIDATTSAQVGGDAVVASGGDLQLSAQSDVVGATTAKASAQGGSSTPGGMTAEYLDNSSGPGASTRPTSPVPARPWRLPAPWPLPT